MTDADFRATKGGVDLNGDCQFGQSFGLLLGGHHEHRQDAVRPAHGFPALDDVRPVRRALRRRQGRSRADVRGTVPGHGLRSTDLPREPARYRSMSVGPGCQALSHGLSRADSAFDAGRCQRVARLAHPCRLRAAPDRSGQSAVCQRGLGAGLVEHDHQRGQAHIFIDNCPCGPACSVVGFLGRPRGFTSRRWPVARSTLATNREFPSGCP